MSLFALGRATAPGAHCAHVEFQLSDGPAQGVAMHSQLSCCLALIAIVLLQYREYESFSEFAHGFGIKNSALIHLRYKSLKLVFHRGPLFPLFI